MKILVIEDKAAFPLMRRAASFTPADGVNPGCRKHCAGADEGISAAFLPVVARLWVL